MKRGGVLKFAEDLPASALEALAADRPAAWLIDVAGGRVLATNPAGATLLGLGGNDAAAPLLDAAMPALIRLRAIAGAAGHDRTTDERLVFWSQCGVRSLRCRIEILGAEPQVLAAVTALADTETRAATVAEAPSLFPGDDAAKLTEIARRIREGKGAAAVAVAAAANAPPTPAPLHLTTTSQRSEAAVPATLRASLAHELKTPASAIAAAAEIMKDERFGPLGGARYVGYAADIHSSAEHMLGLIDSMLAEGAEANVAQRELNFAELDTGEALRVAVSQLVPLAERAGIALLLELAPRLPHVVADATSLRQIVFNLVTNALKFTERGGRVTVAARYSGDGPLAISVSDTGPGMTQSDIEGLIAPGRRRQGQPRRNSRKGVTVTGGLGLGLPLVQALAAANGAELTIDSALDKGTSASVIFGKDRVIPV